MTDDKIDQYYQNQAKELVDLMFDAKLFRDGVTRDAMAAIESYAAFFFQSNACSVKRSVQFLAKMEKLELGKRPKI